jgi:hypothetical protein
MTQVSSTDNASLWALNYSSTPTLDAPPGLGGVVVTNESPCQRTWATITTTTATATATATAAANTTTMLTVAAAAAAATETNTKATYLGAHPGSVVFVPTTTIITTTTVLHWAGVATETGALLDVNVTLTPAGVDALDMTASVAVTNGVPFQPLAWSLPLSTQLRLRAGTLPAGMVGGTRTSTVTRTRTSADGRADPSSFSGGGGGGGGSGGVGLENGTTPVGCDAVLVGCDYGALATAADPAGGALLDSLDPSPRWCADQGGAPGAYWGPDGGAQQLPLLAHLDTAAGTALCVLSHVAPSFCTDCSPRDCIAVHCFSWD